MTASIENIQAEIKKPYRDANLDLLRASAIVMVVVFHIIQRWPVPHPWLSSVTTMGQYGVDLFFVLSGWLIGGLWWRERLVFGNVQIFRFWGRRSLRTVPPYLAALIISWLGVRASRGEPFNWGYLLFLQNYYYKIPYFLVSWSLCVEEHFYVVLPLLLALLVRFSSKLMFGLLLVIAFLPLAQRCYWGGSMQDKPFGIFTTATHIRFEGLLLGVWASGLCHNHNRLWAQAQRLLAHAWPVCLLMFASVGFMSPTYKYAIGFTVVALSFTGLLIKLAGEEPLIESKAIYQVAASSYSVYLVHAVVLAPGMSLVQKLTFLPELIRFVLVIGVVWTCGFIFFALVEKPSLRLRDRFVPRRPREQAKAAFEVR